jgi:hypothetical protein
MLVPSIEITTFVCFTPITFESCLAQQEKPVKRFFATLSQQAPVPSRPASVTLSASGTVIGTAVFSAFTAEGSLINEASVQAVSATTLQAIFVDTQSGFDTGLAYANPPIPGKRRMGPCSRMASRPPGRASSALDGSRQGRSRPRDGCNFLNAQASPALYNASSLPQARSASALL